MLMSKVMVEYLPLAPYSGYLRGSLEELLSNRACVFRYASGSPVMQAKSGYRIHLSLCRQTKISDRKKNELCSVHRPCLPEDGRLKKCAFNAFTGSWRYFSLRNQSLSN